PRTGQLTASFLDNPQIQVSRVRVTLRGGDRATLVNPPTCGAKRVTGRFTGWNGASATATSDIAIDQGCERGGAFGPGLSASVADPRAGGSPAFGLTISRPDGHQQLQRVDVSLPPGLLAKPKGIPLCDDAHAAAGTCAETSRIGSVAVAAGAGGTPYA